jgi:hypothetical protein
MSTPTSHTPSLTSPQLTTLLLAITPLRMNVSPVPDPQKPGMLAHELPAPVLPEVEVLTLVPPAHRPSAPKPPEQLLDKLLPTSKTPTPLPLSIHLAYASVILIVSPGIEPGGIVFPSQNNNTVLHLFGVLQAMWELEIFF